MQWLQPYGIQHLLVFVHHHCLIHIPAENNLKLDEIVADFGICIDIRSEFKPMKMVPKDGLNGLGLKDLLQVC